MAPPLISIVIPTYNHARFLRGALDSVAAQTYEQWEAIVVNNFSEDDTVEIVASYQDPRIRCVNFANHGVIAASRNHGIAQTSGTYIAFLDSDDIWYPQKLEKSMQRMQQGFDLVCHAETWVGPGDATRDVFYGPESRASYSELLYEGNCISTSAVVVKREFIDQVAGFSEAPDLITAEDYHLWLKLAQVGAKIGFVREILGEYRIHDGNNSKAALRNMEAVRAAFEEKHAKSAEHSLRIRIRALRRRAIIDYSGGRGLQENGEHGKARQWFFKAIAHWPFMPKFYVAALLNELRCRVDS